MDMETWRKLLGKSQDDHAVKAALVAAGVKKIPKLEKGYFDVTYNLTGHGLSLVMHDEAFLKKKNDQDIGEGPLILTGVGAYLDKSASSDLYKGKLPYSLKADMTQAAVRETLGPPTRFKEPPAAFDLWTRDDVDAVARYTKDGKLRVFVLMLAGTS
jgi:hypothetical protein